MIALIQRVRYAHVEVGGHIVGKIGRGTLALVGVERGDGGFQVERILERILGYRMFPDSSGRMNRNIAEIQGGLLLVPQFTLAADTRKGMRPSFSAAADPVHGKHLYLRLLELARRRHDDVAAGQFGANMQVYLVNDGPVTFWLQALPTRSEAD